MDAAFPLGVLTTVTGISGSGKSTLVSQALVELMLDHLGHPDEPPETEAPELEVQTPGTRAGRIAEGAQHITRLVRVDQKPIGRTPRSNLATYTGLFDAVRKLFAATPAARSRRYDAGRFSFNVAKGAAKPAREKVSSAWSSSFCRACSHPARPVTARATTRRRWKSAIATKTSPTCWR